MIQAIRAAKAVQMHVAAGGKASDIPPPPPSENMGRPCPHCSRKFSDNAYERHVTVCQNVRHKPNPIGAGRRGK